MKKAFWPFIFPLIICCLSWACAKDEATPTPTPTDTSFFAKGADVSWLTQMETEGRKFYDSTGAQKDCMELLKSMGMNTIRLRVWVNPANGWNNVNDLLVKARRANALGMRILLDFHYSDSWADPGQQTKPAAWNGQSMPALNQSLRDHTVAVMTALKNNNITPTWVQIGNETNDGMLWPEGRASTNMSNFAQLLSTGYDAVKQVSPSSKVMVHISNGYNNSLFRWLFDGLTAYNVRYDLIGMSLYPTTNDWSTLNSQCLNNINDMIARYNKDVMICEVGMSWDQPQACYAFLKDLIAKTKSIPGGRGLGVLYWEPQSYNNWQGYTLGAFGNSGKPTAALNAFKD
jgi:arabinogalactan endo-1,4-beta-galactosidase